MLIRKTQQPSDYPSNQIHDAYSTSTTDTYSCNYINENVGDLIQLTTTDKSSIVGAINSVVESGSNANGSWIKFSDGTMIITQSFTRNIAVTTKDTGTYIYYGSVNEEDIPSYPQTFTSILSANVNIFDNYCMCGTGTQGGAGLSKISTKLYVYCPTSVTKTVQFYVFVIGKWK